MRTFGFSRALRGGRLAAAAAVLLLAATACENGILFEKTNPDPHPPRLLNWQYDPSSIVTADVIRGSFTYADDGGDIELFLMRDTSGTDALDPIPLLPDLGEDEEGGIETSVFFFPGRVGTIEWEMTMESNQAGPHKIQAWLEDSKESISNVVDFEITVYPPGTF
jgi:hypothetical protein